jgi:hypothetical protein
MGSDLGHIRGDLDDCGHAVQDREEARAAVVMRAVVESWTIPAAGVVARTTATCERKENDEDGSQPAHDRLRSKRQAKQDPWESAEIRLSKPRCIRCATVARRLVLYGGPRQATGAV